MEEEKKYCIYMHENIINHKKYIGYTGQNPKNRWASGAGYLAKRPNGNWIHRAFAPAIIKYGWENFTHEILEENLTYQEALDREKYYIALYNTCHGEGYNCTEGGEGCVPNEETREKQRQAKLGKYDGEKNPMYGIHRCGKDSPMWGRHLSPETREKIGKNNQANYEKQRIPVYCLNLNKKYDSIDEAAKELNLDRSAIGKNIRNKQQSVKGYHFLYWEKYKEMSYEEYNELIQQITETEKVVVCVETRKTYDTYANAGKDTGIDRRVIGDCCLGRKDYAGVDASGNRLHWFIKHTELINNKRKENPQNNLNSEG